MYAIPVMEYTDLAAINKPLLLNKSNQLHRSPDRLKHVSERQEN
jgi:hypothetical protein